MAPALTVPGARTFSRSFGLGMLAVIQRSSLQRFHHCESQHPIWTMDLGEFNRKEEEDWTQGPWTHCRSLERILRSYPGLGLLLLIIFFPHL